MTHQAHRLASRSLRPQDASDRRQYQRFDSHGLTVRVETLLCEVHDVSMGGMSIEHTDMAMGTELTLQLFPRLGNKLDLAHSIIAHGFVVGQTGRWTRIRFAGMTFRLAKFLIQHLARCNGVQPYIFK